MPTDPMSPEETQPHHAPPMKPNNEQPDNYNPCPKCGSHIEWTTTDDGDGGRVCCSNRKCNVHLIAVVHDQWNEMTAEQLDAVVAKATPSEPLGVAAVTPPDGFEILPIEWRKDNLPSTGFIWFGKVDEREAWWPVPTGMREAHWACESMIFAAPVGTIDGTHQPATPTREPAEGATPLTDALINQLGDAGYSVAKTFPASKLAFLAKDLETALAEAKARLAEKEKLAEQRRKDYLDVADAICRESSSPEDLANQAREIRQQRDRLFAENERLAALVDEWRTKAMVVENHPAVVALLKERDEARAQLSAAQAQIAAKDALLSEIRVRAHCISKAGPLATPEIEDAWRKFDELSVLAGSHAQPRITDSDRLGFLLKLIAEKGTEGLSEIPWTVTCEDGENSDIILDHAAIDKALSPSCGAELREELDRLRKSNETALKLQAAALDGFEQWSDAEQSRRKSADADTWGYTKAHMMLAWKAARIASDQTIADLTARNAKLEGDACKPIDTAPGDKAKVIGIKDGEMHVTWLQPYYDKWPHDEGGPTYFHQWTYESNGSLLPWSPTHWMPILPMPAARQALDSAPEGRGA